ncbi:GerAB/ArcD/ProY family transporter [Selenihalanaerobacter shriftii]|uniref:Spore germination protein KB n=1 Tax=Selenihalanaerobacter shriftii TaxID=142842 RepID=A0A1T4QC96_9FIRM|nr:endospore germination permease [Selenihalanaerobacter shriftii]SKA01257.1 spore germination protein KB [Selenihalanaerobacter shriftii]
MLEEGKISGKQLQWLLIVVLISTNILFLPSITAKYAAQDSWLSIILAAVVGAIFIYFIVKLALRFPNQTIAGYSSLIVGKFFGKVITLFYILVYLYVNIIIVREFGEVLTSNFLIQTPMELVIALIIIISASAVRNGIEVISRVNELILPTVILFLIIMFILIIPEVDYSNLKPVLADGIFPVIKGTSSHMPIIGEMVVMLMILPAINCPKQAMGSVYKGLMISTILVLLTMIQILALFGTETSQLTLPVLGLIRYISLFGFIERIDALLVASWVGGGFIKITVFYYCMSVATAEFFNLKSYKSVVLPLGVIMLSLSIMIAFNVRVLINLAFERSISLYLAFLVLGIPILLLLIAKIRGIRGEF